MDLVIEEIVQFKASSAESSCEHLKCPKDVDPQLQILTHLLGLAVVGYHPESSLLAA